MYSQTKFKLVMVCLLLISLIFVACDRKAIDENKEETEVILFEAIIPIKMVIPGNWSTSRYTHNLVDYNSKNKFTLSITFDNSLKENLNGTNGLSMTLENPYYVRNKDVESIIPDFETLQKHRCGNNDVYISVPLKTGYVHFDGNYLIHIFIEHWPKNGMTPEIESFFSSLHID